MPNDKKQHYGILLTSFILIQSSLKNDSLPIAIKNQLVIIIYH